MTTIAERQIQVEYIWQDSFQSDLNEELREAIRQAALTSVKVTLEEALHQELNEHLGFERYERDGNGAKPPEAQRSGYFERQVETDHGHIPDLQVPKLRRGNKEREWKILTRYQRCLQHVLDSLLYIYLLGLSLRDLQEAMYVLWGSTLSVSAINRVTTRMQASVAQRLKHPILQTPFIIVVDGVWVKILYSTGRMWIDKSGHERQERCVQERVILASLAVWPDGRYHLLHYEIAEAENQATWKTFLSHMIERGLDPRAVHLLISDGTKGLMAAMKQYLPNARLQRCVAHKIRGFKRYLEYHALLEVDLDTGRLLTPEEAKAQRRADISTDAHEIFKALTLEEAQQRLDLFKTKWTKLEPRAVKNFTWGLKRCFEFYHFDAALYPLIRTTNLIERLFREYRAKSDEIGSFPNEPSCLTLFHLLMARDHAKHNRFVFAKT